MAAVEVFTNEPSTTVAAAAAAGTAGTPETWVVASSSAFPAASTGVTQFHVADPAAPSELIAVTNVSGTSWSVTRGAETTTPVAHAAGYTVQQVVTAGALGSFMYNPMTTLGDLAYGGTSPSAGTPARLAGGTAAAKQFLTQTGTGSASAAPAWGTVATSDLPVTTQAASAAASLALYSAPAGATGETFPRRFTTGVSNPLTTGTLYVTAIGLPAGLPVSNLTMMVNTTAKGGGSHGWYVLLDSNRIVRAVTADQTDASTVWGTVSTTVTLSVAASAYTTTYSGLYYAGVMVAAGTTPTFSTSVNQAGGITTIPPILTGFSSAAQTTPPALGATMATITPSAGFNFYTYTS